MATTDMLHLHPLAFELSLETLPTLNSTQLALVAFHPDAVPSIVNRARIIWHKRRAAALERGEQQITSLAPAAAAAPAPSSSSATSKRPPRPIPRQFDHLVRTLVNAHERGEPHPLRAKVGGMLKEGRHDLYDEPGMPRDFRMYCNEAERLGIVHLSSPGQLAGRDWIALTDEYLPDHLSTSGSSSSASVAPRLASFHLFSLSFPLEIDNMTALSTAQLLAVQFRDDVNDDADARGLTIGDRVEAIFWKRRSLALGAGQKWEDSPKVVAPSSSASIPLTQRIGSRPSHEPAPARNEPVYPVTYPSIDARRPPSPPVHTRRPPSPLVAPATPTPSYPPLPSLYTTLPSGLASSFFVLHVTRLPPNAIDSVASLHALLPHHLHPVATVLYAPSSSPSNPSPSRRAHLAYRLFDTRVGAANAVNNILLKGPTGESWKVFAEGVTKKLPQWEWGDVRKDLREVMWKEVCEKEGVDVSVAAAAAAKATVPVSTTTAVDKRPRDSTASSSSARQPEDEFKRRRVSAADSFGPPPPFAPRSSRRSPSPPVSAAARFGTNTDATRPVGGAAPSSASSARGGGVQSADLVPKSVLDPLYELYVSFGNQPRDLNSHRPRDDLFIGRFGAVGWLLRNVPGKYHFHVIFVNKEDRELAEEWMLNANRYWKNNDMYVDRGVTRPTPNVWTWSNFTEPFRQQHGVPKAIGTGADVWGRPVVVGSMDGKEIPVFSFEKTVYWLGLLKSSREAREAKAGGGGGGGGGERAAPASAADRRPLLRRSASPPAANKATQPSSSRFRLRSPSPPRAPEKDDRYAADAASTLPLEKAAYTRRAGPSEVHVRPLEQVSMTAAVVGGGGGDAQEEGEMRDVEMQPAAAQVEAEEDVEPSSSTSASMSSTSTGSSAQAPVSYPTTTAALGPPVVPVGGSGGLLSRLAAVRDGFLEGFGGSGSPEPGSGSGQ